MNVNDTEILNSILTNSGYVRTSSLEDANVVFLVTVSRTAVHIPKCP
jgi:tRNA A37 methylthiotransferase MiaB